MVTGIILIVVAVAVLVACRAYVREPVLRNVGIALGVVLGVFGLYLFLTALLGGPDVEVEGAPAVVQLAP